MKEEKNYLADLSKLRQKAEEQILTEISELNIADNEADMLMLIHELKIHQVELKMQNEELLLAKAMATDSKFYGYTVNRLEKMNINQINMLQAEQITAEMTLALSERRKYFNFRHRLASGEVRDAEVYSGPIEFDGYARLYSIVRDVTDRKRAQTLLTKMNWRLLVLKHGKRIPTQRI